MPKFYVTWRRTYTVGVLVEASSKELIYSVLDNNEDFEVDLREYGEEDVETQYENTSELTIIPEEEIDLDNYGIELDINDYLHA